jgi:hypothetical protein
LTTLVLLILAAIWAAVIIVPLLRAHSDGTLGDSVGSFRRHLSVLERAAPTGVRPANRLRAPVSQSAIPPYRSVPSNMARTRGTPGRRPGQPPTSAALYRRRQAQRRRRDVLFTLMAAMLGSFLLSMVNGLHIMLMVHVVVDLVFVAYIGLLIRMRNLAAEREMKLTFLPTAAPAPPARGYGNRAAGGNGYANGYARAAGYGG